MKSKLLFSFLLLFEMLSAQTFTEYTQATPFGGLIVSSISFADVDGDNDQDLFLTGTGLGSFFSKLYTNDGLGGFTEVLDTPFDGVIIGSTAFADIDGDNDQDLLIIGLGNSSVGRIAKLYVNDGAGVFTEMIGTPFEGMSKGSIAFADMDGDNDQDLILAGVVNSAEPGIAKLYTNDGTGVFTEVVSTPFDGVSASSIAVADIDGDNDQDVIIAGQNSSYNLISKLYANDGTGGFTEMIGTSFTGVGCGSVAFADIDGDNDQDLLITGQNSSSIGISKLYNNNGSGIFTEVIPSPFKGVRFGSIAFTDVDNDNDQDVLITGLNGLGNRIAELYVNDGTGTFTALMDTPFEGVMESSTAFADIDGDNDEDIFIVGRNSAVEPISKLYINGGLISSSDDLLMDVSLHITPFPNPVVSDKLNIGFNSEENTSIIIGVYSLDGQLMYEKQEIVRIGEQILSVDITPLSAGSYFVQLKKGGKIGTAKFIIP